MPIIGLTGGIGSGKSLVASQFASLGVPVVDTDVISHALTATGMPMVANIAQFFGQAYLNQDASLNRAKLRTLVFSNAEARQQLEALMHPTIHAEALKLLHENAKHRSLAYQLLVVPLLFETSNYANVVNQTLVIDCAPALQIARVLARTGNTMTATDVEAVIKAQIAREARLEKADLVITNDGTPDALMAKVREIHAALSKDCIKHTKS